MSALGGWHHPGGDQHTDAPGKLSPTQTSRAPRSRIRRTVGAIPLGA